MRQVTSKAVHLGPHFQMALGERILIPCFPNSDAKSEAFPSLEENENKNPLKIRKWTNEVCLLFFQFLVSDQK